jgi:catechol 2,3-dioxygenase-like lactoylglutathione lyase family enzyme
MLSPDLTLLYVKSLSASQNFYAGLLGRPPVESSPSFAMFALSSGFKLAIWARDQVQPAALNGSGGAEIVFAAADAAAVRAVHEQWRARGLPIAQAPTEMDFGTTFTALDPDGHRLRVFAPREA